MAVKEQRYYTADDLWRISQLPRYDGKRLFLIDGVIYTMTPAKWLHGDLTGELHYRIAHFVKRHRLGRVTAAETGYTLAPGTTLAPDVGFIAAARVPKKFPDSYVPFAPDLAVEVVSPNDRKNKIDQKIEKYMKHGTRMLCVVFPKEQVFRVYQPSGENQAKVTFLGIDDTFDGGDVLPGFKLPLRELFAPPDGESEDEPSDEPK